MKVNFFLLTRWPFNLGHSYLTWRIWATPGSFFSQPNRLQTLFNPVQRFKTLLRRHVIDFFRHKVSLLIYLFLKFEIQFFWSGRRTWMSLCLARGWCKEIHSYLNNVILELYFYSPIHKNIEINGFGCCQNNQLTEVRKRERGGAEAGARESVWGSASVLQGHPFSSFEDYNCTPPPNRLCILCVANSSGTIKCLSSFPEGLL